MNAPPLRIAMWSGPRNISTAMMRAWGNRPDTFVCDEPLYAHYLLSTGVDHPGRDEVIAHHESDWERATAQLIGPVPGGKPIYYQKHMSHHLLPGRPRGWMEHLTHCFLIRDPREMLTSLLRKYPAAALDDTGLPQQARLFDEVRRGQGAAPAVVDARDVLENPRRWLGLLCDALSVPFDERMLSWPVGRRETDGIWAKYWYDSVERSTGFEPYRPKSDAVPESHQETLDLCMSLFETLHAARLK
jgi:hypothetical protein